MHIYKSTLIAKQIMKYNGALCITKGKSHDRQSKWSITNNILSGHITQLIQLEGEAIEALL